MAYSARQSRRAVRRFHFAVFFFPSAFFFAHRAVTAFLAASLLSSGVRFAAVAVPPKRPSSVTSTTTLTFLPIVAEYTSRRVLLARCRLTYAAPLRILVL